jgi:hypothetical protein
MESIRSWRWLGLTALGLLLALVPVRLTANGALGIQITAAVAGALMATDGAALVNGSWPRKGRSELRYLLAATGFFLLCAGAVAMLAGVACTTELHARPSGPVAVAG